MSAAIEDPGIELQRAARNGNLRLLNKLLAQGARLDAQDKQGWCCLHAAAAEGHIAVVEDLAKQFGVDGVNIQTFDGRTPLYLAALDGKVETVSALLEANANPHTRNKDGRSPQDVAELFERDDVVQLLKDALRRPTPEAPRKPVSSAKREKRGTDRAGELAHAKAAAYKAPDPKDWRRTDFTKWNNLTDEQFDAIDARLELAAKPRAQDRPAATQPALTPVNTSTSITTGKRRELLYGKGRVGPPTVLLPGDENYEHYKAYVDLRERLDARKQPGHRAEEEPLFSLGPRSEGGAEPCQGNGGHGPGYRWTQTPSEVQIIVIPARASAFSFDRRVSNSAGSVATTPASAPLQKDDVACRISAGRLTLRVRAGDEKGKRHAIFDDTPLWRRVRGDASFWAISDGREVHITLTKQVSEWWRCVTDNEDGGHKKIDTAKCRGPDMLSDYEGAEQQELRDFFSKQLSRKL